ncbi:MAG: BrnA antitoxin family protein [Pyrinomonadaceae bacterium]
MNKNTTSKKYGTDIERLRKMKDENIDFSDIPRTTPEFWAKAVVRKGLKPVPAKQQITLRIDKDVIAFFREGGRGYQTKINQLLRAYMEARKAAR